MVGHGSGVYVCMCVFVCVCVSVCVRVCVCMRERLRNEKDHVANIILFIV